jgi:hypothetical protein
MWLGWTMHSSMLPTGTGTARNLLASAAAGVLLLTGRMVLFTLSHVLGVHHSAGCAL